MTDFETTNPDEFDEAFRRVEQDLARVIDTFTDNLGESMRFVGNNINTAMHEVATEVGGEELYRQVTELADFTEDSFLPRSAALEYLESLQPGSARRVMDRSKEIMDEIHAQERREAMNPFSRRSRKAIARGIGLMFGRTGE